MKKLAAFVSLSAATLAVLYVIIAAPFAQAAVKPHEVVLSTGQSSLLNPVIPIELLAVSVTTQTEGVSVPKVVILTAGDGTEDAPTAATSGIDLTDLSGVVVLLKTAGTTTATAGGTLQAYTYNPEVAGWYRVPDLDLTAIAATNQSWPAIYVPVRRGRVTWVPNGISAGVTTIYLIGQEK
jgi:hypothetical protein